MTDIPSADYVRTTIERFLYNFTDRYPASGPILLSGPLDEALTHSLFDPINVNYLFFYRTNRNELYQFAYSLVHLFFIYIMIKASLRIFSVDVFYVRKQSSIIWVHSFSCGHGIEHMSPIILRK